MVISYSDKAGQWAKQQARSVYNRTSLVVYITGAVLLFAAGVIMGMGLLGSWFVLAELILLAFGATLFWRLNAHVARFLDRAATERLRWLRGGQAEAWVSLKLRDSLSDRWHLFDNLKLDPDSDLDHVLIGPGGLFVLSTKSSRGMFEAGSSPRDTSGTSLFNRKPTRWHRDAVQQALRLRQALSLLSDDPKTVPPWVQAVLCLPFAHIDAPRGEEGVPTAGKCWVVHEDSMVEHLAPEAAGDAIRKSRRLSKREVDRWVSVLKRLHDRHA